MGAPVLYGGSSCPQKMGWRVAVIAVLLCGSSQGRPSLLGAAGEDHHHHQEEHHHHEPHQAVDYSYSDYDYQPEEGRSLGAEDEYYEDITPARAYNFQFEGEIHCGARRLRHPQPGRGAAPGTSSVIHGCRGG